ncbi:AAA family ATPase [Candidatus Magnetominusculus dajiuhuensis]|uniref:AAA family ATPase n=1 Tax=Candidatus Magnetominusculus dajiuhuensis TaxID=3137712 RepID=UPI003B42C7E0
MLTRLKIQNFKNLDDVEIELGEYVVFVGPNNCGKTTALQAIALWNVGLRAWNTKRKGKASPEKGPRVAINRKDITAIPVPVARLLWRNLKVRNVKHSNETNPHIDYIFINVIVEGITNGVVWNCGLEFGYANEESFYCRPLRTETWKDDKSRMTVCDEASGIRIAFLPPMSGLAATEPKVEPGRINVLIGEGQTAQVLRNLCYQIYDTDPDSWKKLTLYMKKLFGVDILPPDFIMERGEISMSYKDIAKIKFDISASGRGFQQTLLLLAYLYANPKTVLLLDEPDAHLETLRQRQIYQTLIDVSKETGSQIIIASHSEVIMREAAERDLVIAFLGKNPHSINGRYSQLSKSLTDIPFDNYYLAEQTGWVLYLEGSTDLDILREFAKVLGHEAERYLERPFFHPTNNKDDGVNSHFFALCESKKDLVGIAIYDNLGKDIKKHDQLVQLMWKKNEIENYLCTKETLLDYARYGHATYNDLPDDSEIQRRVTAMEESINEIATALKTIKDTDIWSPTLKASDDVLIPLFKVYFKKISQYNILNKSDYHILARYVPKEDIDAEVVEKLDAIVETAKKAASFNI